MPDKTKTIVKAKHFVECLAFTIQLFIRLTFTSILQDYTLASFTVQYWI